MIVCDLFSIYIRIPQERSIAVPWFSHISGTHPLHGRRCLLIRLYEHKLLHKVTFFLKKKDIKYNKRLIR